MKMPAAIRFCHDCKRVSLASRPDHFFVRRDEDGRACLQKDASHAAFWNLCGRDCIMRFAQGCNESMGLVSLLPPHTSQLGLRHLKR
jgi:hypothetical protein